MDHAADDTPPDTRLRWARALRAGVVAGSLGIAAAAGAEPGTGSVEPGVSSGQVAQAWQPPADEPDPVGDIGGWQGRTPPSSRHGAGPADASTGGS